MELIQIDQEHYVQVADIYQSGIDTGIATFETKAPSWDDWNASHLHYGRLAAIDKSLMLGWASLSLVSSRCVYGGVAELSIYIAEAARKKGVGIRLLNELIDVSEANGIWTLQSGIFRQNLASWRLHEKCGFRVIGYKEKIGQRDGEWYDNVLLERRSKVVGV